MCSFIPDVLQSAHITLLNLPHLPSLPQLSMKEEEIDSLRRQLVQLQGTRIKTEVNMAAQESLIKALQQRQEAEKAAKYKAMYALAERSKNLEECSKQQQQLEEGLVMCKRDLGALRQAAKGGEVSASGDEGR